jgi:hypothetical protein
MALMPGTPHLTLCPACAMPPLQGPPSWHPAPPPLLEAAAAAAAAAAAEGVSLPTLAIKECVRDPAIASHLVGFCTRQQVRWLAAAGVRRRLRHAP